MVERAESFDGSAQAKYDDKRREMVIVIQFPEVTAGDADAQ